MSGIAKTLIMLGVSLVLGGIVWHYFGKSLNLGKLPGDMTFQKGNVKFFFPLTTSILISIALTILFNVIKRFLK